MQLYARQFGVILRKTIIFTITAVRTSHSNFRRPNIYLTSKVLITL